MLEVTGPNTRRKIRPAVAQRVLQYYSLAAFPAVRLDAAGITLGAAEAAVAIDKARESYRCRDARKELRVLRQDADNAMQNAYDRGLTIAGDDTDIRELKTFFCQLSLEKA